MINVAIDWGSTSFRAYLFENHRVVDRRESSCGIGSINIDPSDSTFHSVFYQQVGDWLTTESEILLSGMITSVNGWVETPYIPCPVSCNDIVQTLTQYRTDKHTLYFVPGICQHNPQADVMRGEEVQLLGLHSQRAADGRKQLVIMPGTHSKWALLDKATVQRFRTFVTGELHSTLLAHTLIGRLATENGWCDDTFLNAVSLGHRTSGILAHLFAARSSVLLDTMQPEQVRAYLSGLLIGSEIREAHDMMHDANDNVTLIGTDTLIEKYLIAFKALGISAKPAIANATYPDVTSAGFAALIRHFNA